MSDALDLPREDSGFRTREGRAVPALVLGMLSVVLTVLLLCVCFAPGVLVSVPLGVTAWVLGRSAWDHPTEGAEARTGAISGLVGAVLGVVGLLASVPLVILSGVMDL